MQLFSGLDNKQSKQQDKQGKQTSAAAKITAAVNQAFEKDTGLCAADYPAVVAFMADHLCDVHDLSVDNKSVNFEGYIMALNSGMRSRISFFDAAVKEVLRKNKNFEGTPFISFVKKETNFNDMMWSIVKKYLSFYDNEDDIYDIVISAFQSLFLENFKKAFHDFDGVYLGDKDEVLGHITIEQYIYRLLSRAVIHQSKELTKHTKDRVEITPFEGETEDEALDRAVDKELNSFNIADKKLWAQLLEELRKNMRSMKNYATLERVLQHLLVGDSQKEIADKLGVTSTRVGDHVWYLKKFTQDVAKKLDKEGDSDLLNLLQKNYKMVK